MGLNALFLMENSADRATLAASSSVAAMPVSNLQNPQRTTVFRTAAGGVQTVDVTLPADAPPTQAFALADHNVSISGTVRVQAWTDALGGAAQVLDQTIQAYTPVYGYGQQTYGAELYGGYSQYIAGLSLGEALSVLRPVLLLQITPALNSLYWRITFNDAGLAYYQAGRLYLGPSWEPLVNYSWGSTLRRESRTRRIESRGGQYYSNPRVDRSIFEFRFEWLNQGDRDRLWISLVRLGNSEPFILCMLPVGGWEQASSTFYGTFDEMSFERIRSGQFGVPVRFLESL